MFTAAKEKITNLIWLVDDNKQLDGYTQDVLPIFDLEAKFAALASTPGRWTAMTLPRSMTPSPPPHGG